MTTVPKGPASYFPSIEKKYGQPIEHWKQLIRSSELTKHMEIVGWLKAEHGLGHGHANALVAHTLKEDAWPRAARPTRSPCGERDRSRVGTRTRLRSSMT